MLKSFNKTITNFLSLTFRTDHRMNVNSLDHKGLPRSVTAMIAHLKSLEDHICSWPGVAAEPHRFGGRAFRLGKLEVGHVHNDGAVNIPFPRSLRDELINEGLAQKHSCAPDSGWITFNIREEDDVQRASWLLRLSYLRFVLKAVPNPEKRFEQESQRLRLTPRLRALLACFVPGGECVAA
jgi:hypothetical protein